MINGLLAVISLLSKSKLKQSLQMEDRTIDPATISLIITGIVTIIRTCQERNNPPTDEELVSAARGFEGVRAIRKSAKGAGLRGKRFRLAVRESIDKVQMMSDDELLEEFIKAPELEPDEDGDLGVDYTLF